MNLRPFQREFVRLATRPGIDTACLSLPRGNGKSRLAAHLVSRALSPGDPLFRPGTESVLLAASIEQARLVFRFARATLEPTGEYRFLDSATRCAITHVATNTRLRVNGSNGKTAMGLVDCPLAIADEPGAWATVGGELMFDAIQTAQGKPGSPLKAVYIGTLAPARSGWWHEMIRRGSHGSTYVQALYGNPKRWDRWPTIRKANPLTMISPEFRAKLLEERDDARRDSRLKARFLSYRLNIPSADEATMLLTVDDWDRVLARAPPARDGAPIVGVDLGASRSWSAAVGIWPSGRVEALAVAPGLPDLEAQEKRDRVPRGTYRALVEGGALRVADGLLVPPPSALYGAVCDAWGVPARILCDRFRLGELRDSAGPGVPMFPRRALWSEASADIRGLRKLALDGPLSCAPGSRSLIAASLAVAMVANDTSGNVRMIKRTANNTARDDVAAALVLAAGSLARELAVPAPTFPDWFVA